MSTEKVEKVICENCGGPHERTWVAYELDPEGEQPRWIDGCYCWCYNEYIRDSVNWGRVAEAVPCESPGCRHLAEISPQAGPPAPSAERFPFHCEDCQVKPRWVNVYEMSQEYGGPEEGGWWYDSGEPVESRRYVCTSATAEEHRQVRQAELDNASEDDGGNKGRPQYSHSNSRGRASVYVEDHFARFFPKSRPHYE